MGLAKLKIAFDALNTFRSTVLLLSDDQTYAAWTNEATTLIRLAGEFLAAFREIDDTQELIRRNLFFSELAGPDSSYERARQEVVQMLRKAPATDDDSSGESLEDWGKLSSDYWGFLHFRLRFEMWLGLADSLLSRKPSKKQRSIILRYRENLWQVNREADRQYLWGTTLLCVCSSTLEPELDKHYDYDRSQELLLFFKPLAELVTAIQAAAVSLYQIAMTQAELEEDWLTADLHGGDITDDHAPPRKVPPNAKHSIDFRSAKWFGVKYFFTPVQAACVKVLWEQWEQGTPEVGGKTILDNADSQSERLPLVFRDHPAWGTMIIEGETKGSYRLNPPESK